MVAVMLAEQRIRLDELALREGVHPSTVWRWCLRGVGGVRLESMSVGGKRVTTLQAFQRFVERTSGEITAAERELEAAGA